MKYRFENVICERVVDGDTIDVLIDFGFKITKRERLRLARINAPETRGKEKVAGQKAKRELKSLIEGKKIAIETEKQGKFGRYLAEVYYEIIIDTAMVQNREEININDWLVEKDLAEYKDY